MQHLSQRSGVEAGCRNDCQVVGFAIVREPIKGVAAFIADELLKNDLRRAQSERRAGSAATFGLKDHIVHHSYPLLKVKKSNGGIHYLALHFMSGNPKIQFQSLTRKDVKTFAAENIKWEELDETKKHDLAPLQEVVSDYSHKDYDILTTNCWTFTEAVLKRYIPKSNSGSRTCSPLELLQDASPMVKILACVGGVSAACGACCMGCKATSAASTVAAAKTGAAAVAKVSAAGTKAGAAKGMAQGQMVVVAKHAVSLVDDWYF